MLAMHPKVVDVAVIGVPNEDFGEEVKAIVQPLDMADAGPELERELVAYCREHLADVKCPRSVDFLEELPRRSDGQALQAAAQGPVLGKATRAASSDLRRTVRGTLPGQAIADEHRASAGDERRRGDRPRGGERCGVDHRADDAADRDRRQTGAGLGDARGRRRRAPVELHDAQVEQARPRPPESERERDREQCKVTGDGTASRP